ncbi:hypothetical protein NM688_g4473 [Phlebia brevispora]|uniref:Uncharacterized protein n=1 Tax=Phlebia brevispora TaxID=194682 RepID=A0ACC1T2I7_9APHY|nr:hypothetical protein NM688_g4473 [Phlebia brevispora]
MCSYSSVSTQANHWRLGDITTGLQGTGAEVWRPDVNKIIDAKIGELDAELRDLNLDIHDHPELRFEEHHAHDVLTAFMSKHGFTVTKHYLLETAWLATFTHREGGRTLGVNSEMDALPGIGHACGHNLIAIAGVAVAIAVKTAIEQLDIPGKIVLLGTPGWYFPRKVAQGKLSYWTRERIRGMDACIMCHPGPGVALSASLATTLAIAMMTVEYHGHTAHAAAAPWEGLNALDAAVSAYNNISMLRQQLKPTHRVHGTIRGRDWAPNIIPDYSKMEWYIRAPTRVEVDATLPRVRTCLEAAGLATGCRAEIKDPEHIHFDLRQNKSLGEEFERVFSSKYGMVDKSGSRGASTDFGNVTYALPSLHPGFAIPTVEGGGNHTPEFAKSSATPEAHQATLSVSKALAAVGFRVLADDSFFAKVKETFEQDKTLREIVSS